MKTETKNLAPRLLILITTPSLSEKAAALFNDDGVPLQYTIMHGQGTASSEILDMLGIGRRAFRSPRPQIADRYESGNRLEIRRAEARHQHSHMSATT